MHQKRREINKYLIATIGILFLLQFFVPINNLQAQSDTSSLQLRYPLESGYNFPFSNSGVVSPLLLPPPQNVQQRVVYDPQTNSYVFSEKIGSLDYRPSSMMSFEEYQVYQEQQAKAGYWQSKAREESGAGPAFMKGLRLGNQSIDKVFGSEAISITPQGSAELIFGYSRTTNKNPAIPVRNQKNGSFIFKEKIMMNVTGSIGDKLEIGLNYNTEASFNFENKTKLEYSGKEDEIIKKIEAGNVSFSLPGTLINGSQALFGLYTELQFGRLTVSTILSRQEGTSSSVNVQGGAQQTEYEIDIDKYDANRHFFLSHFFRDNYNDWLENPQNIESQVQIEDIEIWVVNRQNNFESSRNIVAIMDLGEAYGPDGEPNFIGDAMDLAPTNIYNSPASNELNRIYSMISPDPAVRNMSTVDQAFQQRGNFFRVRDYETLENARPLSSREFTVNRQLGYISLNSPLRNDEILAVAFTYTYKGETKKVGELSIDQESPKTLMVKLLKGTNQTPAYPNWDLMMKNVYSIGAYQVSPENFILNVLYRNDRTGVATNVIKENGAMSPTVDEKILLKVLDLDQLDARNEPFPDGMFDFVEGVTINSRNGRVIFPLVEPFGSDLREKMVYGDKESNENIIAARNRTANKYVYEELYDSTQTKAQQVAEKNKFFLKGTYQGSGSSDIMLNAMNIPTGSVKVTAGGVLLQENVDYTVDYTLGRVRILNQGLMESGTPIKVSLESQSMFNLQQKTLLGTHLDYRFSENFNVGGTIMRLNEKPLTEKVGIGEEPIANTIWGLNTSYRTEAPILTKWVDAIPLIETKESSSIIIDAEFAQLIPGQSNAIDKNNEALIDDFEGAQTKIELKSFHPWAISSAPKTSGNFVSEFYNSNEDGIASGYGRAKLSWYIVDPVFYGKSNLRPPINDADLNDHRQREIPTKEIFPNKDDDIQGFTSKIPVLNLNYYPGERGPYNYDAEGIWDNPSADNLEGHWGGMMRELITTDFETSNIEYIEFWMMDPYLEEETQNHSGGDLYIHLGEISEDILRDNRKTFENGFSTSEVRENEEETEWGWIPIGQSLVTAFDNDVNARQFQDIGLDGLNDEEEGEKHPTVSNLDDPSNDNFYHWDYGVYNDNSASILDRYKHFNGLENNSPVSQTTGGDVVQSNTSTPDVEDINEDNTLNTTETYYQYRVQLRRDQFVVGQNYIVDKVERNIDGTSGPVKWYQFRIPVSDYEQKVGAISDFKSIRFLRLVMTNFQEPVVARFATLELVRGEWRRYDNDLQKAVPSVTVQHDPTNFEVSSVNIEENGDKVPVNYILPPEVTRATDPSQTHLKMLNEQSLLVKFEDMQENDGRAIYKNTQLDLRQYENLKMFIHAEALPGEETELQDDDITAFIRIGSDYQNNYYEYELPLKVTEPGKYNGGSLDDQKEVWPVSNEIRVPVQDFVNLKVARNKAMDEDPNNVSSQSIFAMPNIYVDEDGKEQTRLIKVKGNPNLSNIRQIMIGVRNPGDEFNGIDNDGLPKSAEIWFNELRLTDFTNEGGWAANGRVQAKLADLGIINFAGATSKAGFGSIEQKSEERQKEEINQMDVSSNLELGKFFPEKAKVSVPFYVGYSNTTINPLYYPKDPDRKLADVLKEASADDRKDIKKVSQDKTERTSINVTNVRWNKQFKKYKILQPSNLSATVLYTESRASNYSIDYNIMRKYGAGLNYVYNNRPKNIAPLKKWKPVRKPAYRIIRDFNFNAVPSSFTFSSKFDRNYQTMKVRNVYDDVDLVIDPTTNKGFYWDRDYTLRWDLTRALKFNYSATNRSLIEEPRFDAEGNDYWQSDWFEDNNEIWKREVRSNISKGGRNLSFAQKMGLSYTLPLNKIPILNWTNIKFSYDGNYSWIHGPVIDETTDLGHTLKNGNTIKVQGNFNMKNLYNKVDYFKQLDRKYSSNAKKQESDKRYKTVSYSKRTFVNKDKPKNIIHKLKTEDVKVRVTDSEGKEVEVKMVVVNENKLSIEAKEDLRGITVFVEGRIEKGENPLVFIGENSVRFLLGFKNINLTYSRNASTMLNGYLPKTDYLGFDRYDYLNAPGWPTIIGLQDTGITRRFANEGWLTQYESFNSPTLFGVNETFNYRTTFEPFKGFRIDFTGMRQHAQTDEQKYINEYDDDGFENHFIDVPFNSGSYSRSIITIGSAFERVRYENDWHSGTYEKMKENRPVISQRLNAGITDPYADYTQTINRPNLEYGDGYSQNSSEVLMYSFLAAYTGTNPDKVSLNMFSWIALPGWKITFDGLTKLDFVKRYFKTLTVSHGYKSTYSISNYNTNSIYHAANTADTENDIDYPRELLRSGPNNDFVPQFVINSVSINEQLNPVIGFDMTWHNSMLMKFEIKRTRLLALSLNNQQLTESRNHDIVFGAGYRFKDVPLNLSTTGGSKTIKSDLNLRLDATWRRNATILRSLNETSRDMATTGAQKIVLGLTADYVLSQRVNVQFYMDYNNNTPWVSNYFPNSEFSFGFSLRLSL